MNVTAALELLVRLLLPAACLGCGATLGGGAVPLNLCPACRGLLAGCDGTVCSGCARPLPADRHSEGRPPARCGRCRPGPGDGAPACRRMLVGWRYQPPIDGVVKGLKFRRLGYLGDHLAQALLARLGPRERTLLAGCDGVVPVPLHWQRRLGRGYNQAERIAAPLAAGLRRPLRRLLIRRRATTPQSDLPRPERLSNPHGAFGLHPLARLRRRRWSGQRLLLVDDVVTTGATLRSAAATLVAGGASEVVALAACRTPD